MNAERFSHIFTFIGFLPHLCYCVSLKDSGINEGFPTLLTTFIWLLSCEFPQSSETAELTEGFCTPLAFIIFLCSIHPDVLSEAIEIRIGPPT